MTIVELETNPLFVRAFGLLPESWDGHTLETRVVPYNQPATVADPPHFIPYQEMFVPGVFSKQLSTPGRDKVLLNFEHEEGIRGNIGHSLKFYDREDGLYGDFKVSDESDGTKALELINAGFLSGLSVEFHPNPNGNRLVNGIVHRTSARLNRVSLCRYPAYEGAQVLAVREEPEEPPPPPPEVFRVEPMAPELVERLAALGIELRPAEPRRTIGN